MANMRIVSTSLVRATSNNKKDSTPNRVELTPCDLMLLMVGVMQRGLLFHKPSSAGSGDQTTLIQRLKASLSSTLDLFPPLAGRLAQEINHKDNTTSFFIDCNNLGAQFVHAVDNSVTISDILEPVYVPPLVHSFFPLNGTINVEGVSLPLLGVQITELADGIFIGCTVNHSVADGTTLWNFLNSWSSISRSGLHHIKNLPVFDRSFLGSSRYPIRVPLSAIQNSSNGFVQPPMLLERVFHFSKDIISALKAKANREAGVIGKISSLQALLAHVWRSIIRARRELLSEPEKKHNLIIPMGIRSRLEPPLSEEYFGNGVLTGTIALKERELLDLDLGYVALHVNKVVSLQTREKIRSELESLTENPRIVNADFGNKAVIVGGSPRFKVYENDFGWGRPVVVRSGLANRPDGKVILLPGVEEGSMDVEVSLSPETLQALGNDFEFMATDLGDNLNLSSDQKSA